MVMIQALYVSLLLVVDGCCGVELAATISERLKDKGIVQAINVEDTICPTATPGNREAALKVSIHICNQYLIILFWML